MPSYPSVTPPSKRVSPGRCSPSWGRLLLLLRCLGSAAAPEGGSPRFSVGPTALAPPSSSHRPSQRGGGGEAPPHAVRHRPFKEGDILHINKRGPRERGGPFPERGARAGGVRPPKLPLHHPAGVGRQAGFWGGGVLGRRGSLETAGERLASAGRGGGRSALGPPRPGCGTGEGPSGSASASGGTGRRETGHPGRGGHGGDPHRPSPPGGTPKAGAEPPAPPRKPAPSPARGKGAEGSPPRPAAPQQQRGRAQVTNTGLSALPPPFAAPRGHGQGPGLAPPAEGTGDG